MPTSRKQIQNLARDWHEYRDTLALKRQATYRRCWVVSTATYAFCQVATQRSDNDDGRMIFKVVSAQFWNALPHFGDGSLVPIIPFEFAE
jgi:hypothetical protein